VHRRSDSEPPSRRRSVMSSSQRNVVSSSPFIVADLHRQPTQWLCGKNMSRPSSFTKQNPCQKTLCELGKKL